VLHRRNRPFTSKLYALLSLIFPINQFIVLWLFFSIYTDLNVNYHPWQLLPTLLLFLAADIGLIFLFRLAEKNAKIQTKNEILEDEISYQTKYYEQLSSSYDQIRKMRHDIDNHLYSIQAMISLGKTDEASAYPIPKDFH